MAAAGTTVKVSQRIILNQFTAKRLLSALCLALQRHEQAFDVLETDVRRRVRAHDEPARATAAEPAEGLWTLGTPGAPGPRIRV